MMRVTDLDRFNLDQIWKPYWPLRAEASTEAFAWAERDPRGGPYIRKGHLSRAPYSLDQTARELRVPSEWRDCVLNRLYRIGVAFPVWISHPLADVLKELLASSGVKERARAEIERSRAS